MPNSLREIQTNLMQAIVVYTDKLTYFGVNSVNNAIVQAISRPLSELFHKEATTTKRLFLPTATEKDLDVIGKDIARLSKSNSSVILVFVPVSTTINAEAVAGSNQITVVDGSKFLLGQNIRLRGATGNPPDTETATIAGKPSTNVIEITEVLINTYKTGSFVRLRSAIPKETKFDSAQGISFQTTETITVGDLNPLFTGESSGLALLDKVTAISKIAGANSNIPAYSITKLPGAFSSAIQNVSNPIPADGGTDAESDSQYRGRIQNAGARFSIDTKAFFAISAQQTDVTVLRVITKKAIEVNRLDCWIASRSGANYSSEQLQQIKIGVEQRLHSQVKINIYNLIFTSISVSADVSLKPGSNLQAGFNQIAARLSDFLDWRSWEFGATVDDADLLGMIDGADAIENTGNFKINGNSPADVSIADNSLPRFTGLTLRNKDNPAQIIGGVITQGF